MRAPEGWLNVVEFLLDKGVDLSRDRGDGQTPVHCAVIGGQLETVKFLLKQNVPLEVKNIMDELFWDKPFGPRLTEETRRFKLRCDHQGIDCGRGKGPRASCPG